MVFFLKSDFYEIKKKEMALGFFKISKKKNLEYSFITKSIFLKLKQTHQLTTVTELELLIILYIKLWYSNVILRFCEQYINSFF